MAALAISLAQAQVPQGSVSPLPDAPSTQAQKAASPPQPAVHDFWDARNGWLFGGVAAMRAMDGISTRNFRARGRDEILLNNDVVDNAAAFSAIEAAGLGASIGLSYWLHHGGHHKAERWVSILHIGVAGFGVVRNYSLKSRHPAPLPVLR